MCVFKIVTRRAEVEVGNKIVKFLKQQDLQSRLKHENQFIAISELFPSFDLLCAYVRIHWLKEQNFVFSSSSNALDRHKNEGHIEIFIVYMK